MRHGYIVLIDFNFYCSLRHLIHVAFITFERRCLREMSFLLRTVLHVDDWTFLLPINCSTFDGPLARATSMSIRRFKLSSAVLAFKFICCSTQLANIFSCSRGNLNGKIFDAVNVGI